MNSLVSVIIPVFNGDRYLAEAIDSVFAQTYKPIEIIVINDGSKDKSADVVKNYGCRICYAEQENGGTSLARNHGIKISTGEFVAFLDADDLWLEEKIDLQMQLLQKNSILDGVFGQVQQFISPELDDSIKAKIHCPNRQMVGTIPSTLLIKKSAFKKIGDFNSSYAIGEFIDWYARAMDAKLQITNISSLVTLRRLHSNNKGITLTPQINDYTKLLKAILDRRRQ